MSVRPAAVAGLFYPAESRTLNAQVAALLAEVPGPSNRGPKALLVPHAGYVYSGSTAAAGYASVAARGSTLERVVILGPAHRVAFDGLALSTSSAFQTPLGELAVVAVEPETRSALPQLVDNDAAHAQEHSVEVQLPFVQHLFGQVPVLPIVVGRAAPEQVAQVLAALWGGPETLVLISSDLSHYLSHDEATTRDAATVRQILELRGYLSHDQACGATPANGLLHYGREWFGRDRLQAQLLAHCNSGDTAGDKRRVVGYASVGFYSDDVGA